jgi:L-aminopeptidase/D-esterase-like protein
MQEAITLIVFVPRGHVRQPIKPIWAALCIMGAATACTPAVTRPNRAVTPRDRAGRAERAPPGPGGTTVAPARDLGVPLDGTPGPLDAITDVRGITVGHTTIIRGTGRLTMGKGPVRTGVTTIFPRGRDDLSPVFAGWFSMNGNGEMTGTAWLDDYGLLFYPIAITNTNSVGTVRDALIEWGASRLPDALHCCLPVVAETWDGDLSDIFGFHVTKAHVFDAIAAAKGGPVAEGGVGGGTGMICFEFKGGIGTASRRLAAADGGFTVAALVQCNLGVRSQLRIAGIPVGRELQVEAHLTTRAPDPTMAPQRCGAPAAIGVGAPRERAAGSHHRGAGDGRAAHAASAQERRPAGRSASVAWARDPEAGSGDLFLAFSTAPTGTPDARGRHGSNAERRRDRPLYEAAVQATEEAMINAMLAGRYRATGAYHAARRPPGVLRRHGRLLGSSARALTTCLRSTVPRLPAAAASGWNVLQICRYGSIINATNRSSAVERKPTPELERGEGRAWRGDAARSSAASVLEPVRPVGHREPGRFEEGRRRAADGRRQGSWATAARPRGATSACSAEPTVAARGP